MTQLILSLCLNNFYRFIDINDLIFNMFGVIVGHLIFMIVSIILLKIIDEHFKHNKLTQYIYEASTGKL